MQGAPRAPWFDCMPVVSGARSAPYLNAAIAGCTPCTMENMQAVDPWCAQRTLQTVQYLNAMIVPVAPSLLNTRHNLLYYM